MQKFVQRAKEIFKDESGQGATEYILLLVVVVAIAMMFRDKITSAIKDKLASLSSSLASFTGDGGGSQ
jgi:Flp pilus assembly pilin Flp